MTDTKKPTNQEGDDALVLELDEGDQSWDHAVEGWGDSLDEVVLEPPEPAATTDGQTSETGNAGPQEAGEKEVSNTEKDDDPLLDLSDAEEQDALEQTSLSVAPGASSRPPPPLPSKIPSPPSLLAPPSAQTKRDSALAEDPVRPPSAPPTPDDATTPGPIPPPAASVLPPLFAEQPGGAPVGGEGSRSGLSFESLFDVSDTDDGDEKTGIFDLKHLGMDPDGPSSEHQEVTDRTEERAQIALTPRMSAADRGATTAHRTVHMRKARKVELPLTGNGSEARRARIELLCELARRSDASYACDLLCQAGGIAERLGARSQAQELYASALERLPGARRPLWALQRLALRTEALSDAEGSGSSGGGQPAPGSLEDLLDAETRLELPAAERAEALCRRARFKLHRHRDRVAALRDAQEAIAIQPDSAEASLLLARLAGMAGGDTDTLEARLRSLAKRWESGTVASALRAVSATLAHQRGDLAQVREDTREAVARPEAGLELRLRNAQASRSQRAFREAAESLRNAAMLNPPGPIRDALLRQAARGMSGDLQAHGEATRLLADSEDPIARRCAANFALLDVNASDRSECLQRWAALASGEERARALLLLSEEQRSQGDSAEAARALTEAQSSAPGMPITAVMRELLARDAEGQESLASTLGDPEQGRGALAAAAKAALQATASTEEERWLETARAGDQEAVACSLLTTDVVAGSGTDGRLQERLTQQLDERSEEQISLLITLAKLTRDANHTSQAEATRALAEQHTEALRSEVGNYWLARVGSIEQRSERLQSLAERATSPDLAANLLHLAARLDGETTQTRQAGEPPRVSPPAASSELLERALRTRAGHLPIERALLQDGVPLTQPLRRVELCRARAERSQEHEERTRHLVSASIVEAQNDREAALELVNRALEGLPRDPVLQDLRQRLTRDSHSEAELEQVLETALDGASLGRADLLVEAASTLEQARQWNRARALYEAALEKTDIGDPTATATAILGFERSASVGNATTALRNRLDSHTQDRRLETRLQLLLELLPLVPDDSGDRADLERTARQLIERQPNNHAAARALERCALLQVGDASLGAEEARFSLAQSIESQLLASADDPDEIVARLRMLGMLLQMEGASKGRGVDSPEAQSSRARLDDLLLEYAPDVRSTTWQARQLEGAALERQDNSALSRARALALENASAPLEYASAALRYADLPRRAEKSDRNDKIEALRRADREAPDHPLIKERLAIWQSERGEHREAAESLEQAASEARDPGRRARLWYRAGVVWQDALDDPGRARKALEASAQLDIGHGDLHERLKRLLTESHDRQGLVSLTRTRIKAGGSVEQLVALHRTMSELQEQLGDQDAAVRSLQDALELRQDDADCLDQLALLLSTTGRWHDCAKVLIRAARVEQRPSKLRDVFMRLGDVYDRHLPDTKRAEASFRRVLQIDPQCGEAVARLASLYARSNRPQQVAQAFSVADRIPGTELDRCMIMLELAASQTAAGHTRDAERTLDDLRKQHPVDLDVTRALAEHYASQQAESARSMHLNRAADLFRAEALSNPHRAEVWHGLVQVMLWRGLLDPARCCASVGIALGHQLEGLREADEQHFEARSALSSVRGAAADASIEDLLAPETLTTATRRSLRLVGGVLDKVQPGRQTSTAGPLDREHPLWIEARTVTGWFGISLGEISIGDGDDGWLIREAQPLSLQIDQPLLDSLDAGEQRFLLARACHLVQGRLDVLVRVNTDLVSLTMHALVKSFVDGHTCRGLDPIAVDNLAKQIRKTTPRKLRKVLNSSALEMSGTEGFDPADLPRSAREFSNRGALLATGETTSALSALCKIEGVPATEEKRATQIMACEQARSLAEFACSSRFTEARTRVRADRV